MAMLVYQRVVSVFEYPAAPSDEHDIALRSPVDAKYGAIHALEPCWQLGCFLNVDGTNHPKYCGYLWIGISHLTFGPGFLPSPVFQDYELIWVDWEICLENEQLVGGLVAIFYFPIYWESHHPNWRTHFFSEGFKPPTRQKFAADLSPGFVWPGQSDGHVEPEAPSRAQGLTMGSGCQMWGVS